MTHPAYIRAKARQMRIEKDLTIDEISERLGISRQTIFYWVRDIALKKERRQAPGQRRRARTNRARFKEKRDAAYEQRALEPTFRDFVSLYVGEGSKRNRNTVAICNSDPTVIVVSNYWIRRLSARKLSYSLQYHADQDVDELRAFWGDLVGVEPEVIRLQRKSNSNQMARRTWRSVYGVLTILTSDTYLRARPQAWMDRMAGEWLDCFSDGA